MFLRALVIKKVEPNRSETENLQRRAFFQFQNLHFQQICMKFTYEHFLICICSNPDIQGLANRIEPRKRTHALCCSSATEELP